MINKGYFLRKETEAPEGYISIEISDGLWFHGKESNIFPGKVARRPSLKEIMVELNIHFLYCSHMIFNGMGLSTQVPAKTLILAEKPLEIKTMPWLVILGDSTPFKGLTQREFNVVECVNNFDQAFIGDYTKHRADTMYKVYKYFKKENMSLDKIKKYLKDTEEAKIFLFFSKPNAFVAKEEIDRLFLNYFFKNGVSPLEGPRADNPYLKLRSKMFGFY